LKLGAGGSGVAEQMKGNEEDVPSMLEWQERNEQKMQNSTRTKPCPSVGRERLDELI